VTARRSEHPVFVRFYERLSRATDEGWEGGLRDEVCADLRGRILEVGAGNGVNFGHYRTAERVMAIEPEPNMLRLAADRAGTAPVPVSLVRASAERLPFGDAVFDAAVCSLVLCTIPDPRAALAEVRRVLRPDGVLRIYEHVRASRGGVAQVQDLIERPWGFFAGGCHPNRDTVGALHLAGFEVDVRSFRPPVFGSWLLPHVLGEARPRTPAP
jgi:ubiquinone/menaquinone biosynthesis C-methylase UbiE